MMTSVYVCKGLTKFLKYQSTCATFKCECFFDIVADNTWIILMLVLRIFMIVNTDLQLPRCNKPPSSWQYLELYDQQTVGKNPQCDHWCKKPRRDCNDWNWTAQWTSLPQCQCEHEANWAVVWRWLVTAAYKEYHILTSDLIAVRFECTSWNTLMGTFWRDSARISFWSLRSWRGLSVTAIFSSFDMLCHFSDICDISSEAFWWRWPDGRAVKKNLLNMHWW